MFSRVAKVASREGNVLLPAWLNQETFFRNFKWSVTAFLRAGNPCKTLQFILIINAFIHQALEAELTGRFAHCETVCAKGQSLIDRGHYASKEIRAKIKQLQNNWMKLRELLITRSERLKDAAQSLQVR